MGVSKSAGGKALGGRAASYVSWKKKKIVTLITAWRIYNLSTTLPLYKHTHTQYSYILKSEAVHTITLIRDIEWYSIIIIHPIICLTTLCTQYHMHTPTLYLSTTASEVQLCPGRRWRWWWWRRGFRRERFCLKRDWNVRLYISFIIIIIKIN